MIDKMVKSQIEYARQKIKKDKALREMGILDGDGKERLIIIRSERLERCVVCKKYFRYDVKIYFHIFCRFLYFL